jgi:hypothetical protein
MASPCLVVVEMNGSSLGEVSNEAWKRGTSREVHYWCYVPGCAVRLHLGGYMSDPFHCYQKLLTAPQRAHR